MNLRDMMFVALFTAIIGAMAFFPPILIPGIPVPITAQTLGVMLAGGLLGAKRGGLSLLIFIALVAVGVPLLAGGRGGLGALLGPGGGYILAWPIAAFVIGYLVEKNITHLNLFKFFIFKVLVEILMFIFGGMIILRSFFNLLGALTPVSALPLIPVDF